MKKFFVTAAAFAAAYGAMLSASATSLVKMDLATMVDESSSVFVGEAVEQHSAETEYGLYTMTTFAVSDAVVGDANSTVTVATPGGVRTNGKFKFAETWPGAPRFIQGQEILMFVTPNDGAIGRRVVGFSQGAMPVMNTAKGKAVRLPDSNGELVMLDQMKAKIRAARKSRAERRKRKNVSDD